MTRPAPGTTLQPPTRSDADPPADAADVALAASGDGRAFERLYRANAARIHGLARRLAGPDRADELTQDVFVRAWRKLHTFRGDAKFSTWLHRLAVNHILGRRRAEGVERQRTADDTALELAPARRGGMELRLDFETAIARLPDGMREVFVLHDVEGYRHEEIAESLGIAVGTSKSQLSRARMALRRHLDA